MCSIAGYYINKLNGNSQQIVLDLFTRSEERGKDSFGIVWKDLDGRILNPYKVVGPYSQLADPWSLIEKGVAIANFRAEPTTEFVADKTLEDVQPFVARYEDFRGSVWAVHNGTIRNDKVIRENEERFHTRTTIDSAVIPFMYAKYGISAFERLIGSWGVAMLEGWGPPRIILARNYKPIWVYEDRDGNWYFGSQPNYLPRGAWEMDPYSVAELSAQGFRYLLKEKRENNRAIVICSGGLDSCVSAYVAKHVDNMDITLVHFRYGCLAEGPEDRAVRRIASELEVPCKFFDLDFLKQLGGSPIIDGGTIAGGEAGAEFATEWVPARNSVFLAMVAAYCDRYDIGNIYMGLNLEEGSSFPDNSESFYQYMEKAFDVGTMSRPKLHAPFIHKVKHEIVAEGLRLKVPMGLTWSCYKGGSTQCGDCGPCYMRMNAFRMNGVKDPAFPETWGNPFWDSCVEPLITNR